MGADATVVFLDSFPKSSQWDFTSWNRSIVSECSVPLSQRRACALLQVGCFSMDYEAKMAGKNVPVIDAMLTLSG